MSKNISRRAFLKSAVAGAGALAATSVLSACASTTECPECPEGEKVECPSVPDTSSLPVGISADDIKNSVVETEAITSFDKEIDVDVVVCGAGAAGVVAAIVAAEEGASVALLQKQSIVVSQGNCGSCILKGQSTEAGLEKWIHHTNSLGDWRADTDLLRAYVDHSEEAVMWVMDKAGMTKENGWSNETTGLKAYLDTSATFTKVWKDRCDTYDYGDDKVSFFAPWLGPKPNNIGTVLGHILDDAMAKFGTQLDVHFSTPVVQLVTSGNKVTGCIGKEDGTGKYIKFNAKKGVILATGDYMNNESMVNEYCPDVADYDKKQYGKTGDGHILAVMAGAKMNNLGHTKMMHDFDSGQMYEEPFLYLNMEGKRFTNEDTGFVYMGNILRRQPKYKGANVDANHPNGSAGWYCQIYDNDYPSYANNPFPAEAMRKYMPEEDADRTGVFDYLIDTYKADTLEELVQKLGLPKDEALKSIERYNELCAKGSDADFGKNSKYMNAVKTAPFWGIRKHIRVSSLNSGVHINANGQALDADGNIVPGLYCIGNLGGEFYGGADYPFHQTGLSIGRCYTFGMIAGRHAARS